MEDGRFGLSDFRHEELYANRPVSATILVT